MFKCPIVSKFRGDPRITNRYLIVFFEDLMDSFEILADCITNRKPIPYTDVKRHIGLRDAYKIMAGPAGMSTTSDIVGSILDAVVEGKKSFSSTMLVEIAQFSTFNDVANEFMAAFNANYDDSIPEDEKTTAPFGLTISFSDEEYRAMCATYTHGNISAKMTRELYENTYLPLLKATLPITAPSYDEFLSTHDRVIADEINRVRKEVEDINMLKTDINTSYRDV